MRCHVVVARLLFVVSFLSLACLFCLSSTDNVDETVEVGGGDGGGANVIVVVDDRSTHDVRIITAVFALTLTRLTLVDI